MRRCPKVIGMSRLADRTHARVVTSLLSPESPLPNRLVEMISRPTTGNARDRLALGDQAIASGVTF